MGLRRTFGTNPCTLRMWDSSDTGIPVDPSCNRWHRRLILLRTWHGCLSTCFVNAPENVFTRWVSAGPVRRPPRSIRGGFGSTTRSRIRPCGQGFPPRSRMPESAAPAVRFPALDFPKSGLSRPARGTTHVFPGERIGRIRMTGRHVARQFRDQRIRENASGASGNQFCSPLHDSVPVHGAAGYRYSPERIAGCVSSIPAGAVNLCGLAKLVRFFGSCVVNRF